MRRDGIEAFGGKDTMELGKGVGRASSPVVNRVSVHSSIDERQHFYSTSSCLARIHGLQFPL